MRIPIDWLLEGDPWIEYRTRRDLLGQSEKDPQVMSARESMLTEAKVRGLVSELADWPGSVLSNHKSAGHPIHKLTFLADMGLVSDDPGMGVIIARILKHQSAEGPFQVTMNIPVHFGGTGQDQWACGESGHILSGGMPLQGEGWAMALVPATRCRGGS